MTYKQWIKSLTEDDVNWYMCMYKDEKHPLRVAYENECEDKG